MPLLVSGARCLRVAPRIAATLRSSNAGRRCPACGLFASRIRSPGRVSVEEPRATPTPPGATGETVRTRLPISGCRCRVHWQKTSQEPPPACTGRRARLALGHGKGHPGDRCVAGAESELRLARLPE